MTNREKLAQLTNEELAKLIWETKTKCEFCICTGKIHTYCNGWCEVSIENWLKSEVKE